MALGLLGALIGLSVHQIWEFVSYREQKGAISQIERVASQFPDDAVIVFNRSDLGELVAPPLKLVHGLETFVMGPAGASESYRTLCGPEHEYPSPQEPSSCILSKLASSIPDRPLFWVTPTPSRQPRFVQEAFQRVDGRGIRINVPRLEAPLTRLPKKSGAYPVILTGAIFQLRR